MSVKQSDNLGQPVLPASFDNLSVVIYPDPVLKQRCAAVRQFDEQLRRFAEHMLRIMHEKKGVGLAAPQVGVPIQLFVCNHTGEPEDDTIYVNPMLSEFEGAEEMEEGCLSIPDAGVTMRRAKRATIKAVDTSGNPVEKTADDLEARVWQHETDHLLGKLIIDNMSDADAIANRRVLKQLRAAKGQ